MRDTLMAIAQVVDAGQFYSLLDGTLSGLFAAVERAKTPGSLADVAYSLAMWLRLQQPQSVQQLVFPATLLTAALSADLPVATNEALKTEILNLAEAYAQLNPTAPSQEPIDFFLDTLWMAQSREDFQKGVTEFAQFVEGVEDPTKLLRFETNLLRAIGQAGQELQVEKQDSKFLSALTQLGGAYAALNPNETIAGEEPLNFFLHTLWNAQDQTDIQKGAMEFGQFVEGADNPTQMIEYQRNLLMALKQVAPLHGELHDVTFIKNKVDFGALYLALRSADVVVADPSDFLPKIWNAKDKTDIEVAATHLENFIEGLSNSERVYPLPSLQDESLYAIAIAIPIVVLDVLIVVSATGIAISLASTNNDEAQENIRIIVNDATDTVADVSDRIMQSIGQVSSSAGQALEGFRGLIEDVVQQNFFPIDGKGLRGETRRLAQHLARYLRVPSIGGMPSEEPPDPRKDPENHWWGEIVAFLKNIQTAIKGASRRQVLRELREEFTDEQIEEIERALAEVARLRGEATPRFIPPPRY